MHARLFFRVGLFAFPLAGLIAVGCNSHSGSSASQPGKSNAEVVKRAETPATAPTAVAPQVDDGSAAPLSNTLAQKTSEYARNLEPTASPSRRGAKNPAGGPAEPSAVQWDEPKRSVGAQEGTKTAPSPIAAANTGARLSSPPDRPKTAPPPANGAQPAAAGIAPGDDAKHAPSLARATRSSALNDIPAIVPESSDFGGSNSPSAPDTLEQRLVKRARDNPRDVAAQLDVELYGLIRDEPSPQLASLATLPGEDKEVVAALVDGISNFRTGVRQDANMLLSRKIRPLTDMADRLRTRAELAVPTIALCKRVDGFGRYEPIDPPRFPAGRENSVIVYCEIENFESHLNDKRLWETKLTQQVNLYTETGMLVWPDKSRPVSDECRNRRHDFFLYNVLKLPANLNIGRYLLKVSIEDRTANRVAEATLSIEMVGQ